MSQRIVFTDLDGTLLHPITYSYHESVEAVKWLRENGIPIVFCSAKTRAEQKVYRGELGIEDPFIVENGGAIFIPKDYFSFSFDFDKNVSGYFVIELGLPYGEIRQRLELIRRETELSFKGFGDMSVEEVADETGLGLTAAALAKQREYDETLKIESPAEKLAQFWDKIKSAGLNYAHGGRYYDVMGNNDKGKATRILIELFRRKFEIVESIGIGDSQNDLPMLKVVDLPVLVQKLGNWWEELSLPRLYKATGVNGQGWTEAIRRLFIGN